MADAGVPCTLYLSNGRQNLTFGYDVRTAYSPVDPRISTGLTTKNERLGVLPKSLVAACLLV